MDRAIGEDSNNPTTMKEIGKSYLAKAALFWKMDRSDVALWKYKKAFQCFQISLSFHSNRSLCKRSSRRIEKDCDLMCVSLIGIVQVLLHQENLSEASDTLSLLQELVLTLYRPTHEFNTYVNAMHMHYDRLHMRLREERESMLEVIRSEYSRRYGGDGQGEKVERWACKQWKLKEEEDIAMGVLGLKEAHKRAAVEDERVGQSVMASVGGVNEGDVSEEGGRQRMVSFSARRNRGLSGTGIIVTPSQDQTKKRKSIMRETPDSGIKIRLNLNLEGKFTNSEVKNKLRSIIRPQTHRSTAKKSTTLATTFITPRGDHSPQTSLDPLNSSRSAVPQCNKSAQKHKQTNARLSISAESIVGQQDQKQNNESYVYVPRNYDHDDFQRREPRKLTLSEFATDLISRRVVDVKAVLSGTPEKLIQKDPPRLKADRDRILAKKFMLRIKRETKIDPCTFQKMDQTIKDIEFEDKCCQSMSRNRSTELIASYISSTLRNINLSSTKGSLSERAHSAEPHPLIVDANKSTSSVFQNTSLSKIGFGLFKLAKGIRPSNKLLTHMSNHPNIFKLKKFLTSRKEIHKSHKLYEEEERKLTSSCLREAMKPAERKKDEANEQIKRTMQHLQTEMKDLDSRLESLRQPRIKREEADTSYPAIPQLNINSSLLQQSNLADSLSSKAERRRRLMANMGHLTRFIEETSSENEDEKFGR